jgi:hypothetical protein
MEHDPSSFAGGAPPSGFVFVAVSVVVVVLVPNTHFTQA